ncbi:hypothetical protein [Plasmodium yoelii yoelii]|uniref:Ribosomal RNA-processing protein 14/surfeit locus protein 6 C-terminal domain-containing protein n=1 Tax=Plasmodium yoelii yoelii TaxID=73239 RepID=Q7RHR8_PLAYO|nr:hypothetical protein [Plasmodium yoelii yoelii]
MINSEFMKTYIFACFFFIHKHIHFYFIAFFRKLEKEKKLLNSLESKEKEKTKHLLNVQKAILKSKGEKVYDEKSLKNRKKNILKKKEKSRKRWNNKNDE